MGEAMAATEEWYKNDGDWSIYSGYFCGLYMVEWELDGGKKSVARL